MELGLDLAWLADGARPDEVEDAPKLRLEDEHEGFPERARRLARDVEHPRGLGSIDARRFLGQHGPARP